MVWGMKSGIELITDERSRQVSKEGWSAEHDDEHDKGQILTAGIAYAIAAMHQRLHGKRADMDFVRQMYWPWQASWWKPKDPIRNLVRAGALIAAEIDRLNRAASN